MKSITEMSRETGLHQNTIRLRIEKKPYLAQYCPDRKKIVVDYDKFMRVVWKSKGRPKQHFD